MPIIMSSCSMSLAEQEPVPVTVVFLDDDRAVEGPGWYCWESEYPEEGYFFFSATERPTAQQLRDICPEYVEKGI